MSFVKWIINYVSGTLDYGLRYPFDSSLVIVRYSDANWTKNVENRKSILSAFLFVSDCLVVWLSKKRNSISLSTMEVENIVVGSCCTQLPWMKQMLSDYDSEQGIMNIHCDNSSPINIFF